VYENETPDQRTHAHPTKLVFALLTRHMALTPVHQTHIQKPVAQHSLAPPILLNRTHTHTTLLGIALDPIRRLAVVPTLLEPHSCGPTHNWPVIALNGTPKAEFVLLASNAKARGSL